MILSIFIIVCVGVLLNRISGKYLLKGLGYKRNISKAIVEIGEEFEVESILENKKIIPITFLRVNEICPSVIEYVNEAVTEKLSNTILHSMTMTLLPFQRKKRRYRVKANRRGRYLFANATLMVGDILGLKVFDSTLSPYNEIVVLPEKSVLNEEIVPYGDFNGDISVRRWIIEDPVLIVGVREYTGMEPQKTIHWPSSLKSGRLMVKKFDYTTDNRVMILLNVESCRPFWLNTDFDKIEKCISLVRAIAEELEDSGIPYGLGSNGAIMGRSVEEITVPGWGPAHYEDIIERLGRLSQEINLQFEEMIEEILSREIQYGTYIMVMPYVLEQYIEYINILGDKCQRLIIIAMDDRNFDLLTQNIIKYVKRGEKH